MIRRSGFTLIELSIVLVIIALLVGGVLVGRELINTSMYRQQLAQIDSIVTSVNAFKMRYGGLPGDIRNAVSLGLGTDANLHNGDGNGKIDTLCFSAFHSTGYNMTKEAANFFYHLSNAGLYPQNFTGYVSVASGTWWTENETNGYYPKGKVWPNTYIIPSQYDNACAGGSSMYDTLPQGIGIISTDFSQATPYFWRFTITGENAKLIDGKVDDGILASGVVRMQGTDGYQVGLPNTTLGSCSTVPPSAYPNCLYVRGLFWANRF